MTSPRDRPIPIFLDCDTGIDDALALAYLLADPGVQVVGIGTVSGNIDAVRAAENTLALLALAGRTDIPVAVGAIDPLVGRFGGGAPEVHGQDGVGGVGLKPTATRTVDATAIALLASLAAEWEGTLRVLAVGPLTNLAHLLDLHPECEALIAEVIVMGGAFTAPGNVSGTAEANIFHDPEAAARVFDANWPLTILPLDITMQHVLTDAESRSIGDISGMLPPILASMLHFYLDAYERFLGVRECALHDPLAALVASGAVEVVSEHRPIKMEVVTEGPERGRTVARLPEDGAPVGRDRIIREIDSRAADVILRALRTHPWPREAPAHPL